MLVTFGQFVVVKYNRRRKWRWSEWPEKKMNWLECNMKETLWEKESKGKVPVERQQQDTEQVNSTKQQQIKKDSTRRHNISERPEKIKGQTMRRYAKHAELSMMMNMIRKIKSVTNFFISYIDIDSCALGVYKRPAISCS